MEKETFKYRYSSERNREIEAIRSKYLPKVESKIDVLKRLDARVRDAGQLEGLTVGVVGALVFGIGMCIGLGAIAAAPILAALFGTVGAAIMVCAYPIYRSISRRIRNELTPEILRLSDEILNEKN